MVVLDGFRTLWNFKVSFGTMASLPSQVSESWHETEHVPLPHLDLFESAFLPAQDTKLE